MSRYIKTDALMEDIWSLYREEEHIDYNVAIVDALNVIDEQPTADVVEVVRCKDCRYGHQYTNDRVYCSLGHDMYAYRPNDYCSYGERRGDEQIH